MKKDIKDYLHLYLGCECMIGDLNWKPETNLYGLAPGIDVNYGKPIRTVIDAHVLSVFSHKTTLILRKLDSITEEEAKIYSSIKTIREKVPALGLMRYDAEGIRYLLSIGMDLFNLIPEGLAIDKNKKD